MSWRSTHGLEPDRHPQPDVAPGSAFVLNLPGYSYKGIYSCERSEATGNIHNPGLSCGQKTIGEGPRRSLVDQDQTVAGPLDMRGTFGVGMVRCKRQGVHEYDGLLSDSF